MPSAMEETGDFQVFWKSAIQRAPLGLTQGFAISFYTSSTGQLALLQLLSSQERKKMVEELLERNKQNLNVRPSGARCTLSGP